MTTTIPKQVNASTKATPVMATPVTLALRDIAPFAFSLIPFSLAVGSVGAVSGMTPAEAAGAAVFLLSGGAQLAGVELLAGGAGALVVLSTVALVNFRLLLYGGGMARWFSDAPRWQQVALGAFVIDQNYLVTEQRLDKLPTLSDRRRYFVTATACLVFVFLNCQLIGYHVGAALPSSLGLHLAGPLLFAGMLAKSVVGRRQLLVAGVAGAVFMSTVGIVGGAAMPLATIAALVVGTRTRSTS